MNPDTCTTNPRSLRRAVARLSLFGLLAALVACDRSEDFEILQSFAADDSTIVVEAALGPRDDGTTAVRIRRIDVVDDEGIVIFDSSIANDGDSLTLDNLRPELRSPSDLRLCLNGNAQSDVFVQINAKVRIVSSRERVCTR